MTKENWEDIHKNFDGFWQKRWEEKNFTRQEAEAWIEKGLKPDDYEFATYCKWKNYQPSQGSNLKQLREKFNTWEKTNKSAQEYLDRFYPKEKRKTIEELNIINKNLTGSLDLVDFVNLERLNCWDNQLTKLNVNHLTNLIELICFNNRLTSLDLTDCYRLKGLDCGGNHLRDLRLPSQSEQLTYLSLKNNNFPEQDLSFLSGLVNLKKLWLGNHDQVKINQDIYNRFAGSLGFLRNLTQLKTLDISNTNIHKDIKCLPESIEGFSCLANYVRNAKVKTVYDLFTNNQGKVEADWTGYMKNFPQKLQWIKLGFTKEERSFWINAGAKLNDAKFVKWLKNTKKETPEWITNYKEDYEVLSERFKKYGVCKECNQPNTGEKWCQSCNVSRLQKDFSKWTSQNPQIDEFIQKYQLEATEANKFIEWIPYEQFKDVEYLAQGGFGKVYKAQWKEGNVNHWDTKNKQWQREKQEIVLKSLNDSQDNINFLQETEKHKIIDDWFNNIVPCYGLSQDPKTGNYLMVMQYMPEGNLRHYLGNNNKELTLKDKLDQLLHISQGLKDIHSKNLVHRDFHSGNILKGIERADCLITDLGLCKPANEAKQEEKVFGVMPYVAPEVLNSKSYTQKADIYSFGIIAYEMLSGLPPYYDRNHDVSLGVQICNGLRPKFQIKIPRLLEDLIKRCWSNDPLKRPTANELERILRNWEQNTEFKKQLQEAEEYNKNLSDEIKFPDYKNKMHTGAVYTSQSLPTKEITKLLSSSLDSSLDDLDLNDFQGEQEETLVEARREQVTQILQPTTPPFNPNK